VADDVPRRAPHHHDQGGRPDRRPAARTDRGAGHARASPPARRRLPPPLPAAGARRRARGVRVIDEAQDEIGKAYDARLLQRLWTFVRPYRGIFWAALLLSSVNQAFSLVQPYLLVVGIDRYVAAQDTTGLTRLAVVFFVA